MSDTIEPGKLKSIWTRPLYPGRLRHTPLRDLVRLRITDRLDWRGRIARSELPEPARALIGRVVRRTRLWRIERAAVADELIAHFADGLARGERGDALVRDFGDERRAARLIRRAKRRNRSWLWHARVWLTRALMGLIAVYLLLFARFLLGRPSVTVDYVAQLNASALRTPVEGRAWPLYRRALLDLKLERTDDPDQLRARLRSRAPRDWPAIVAWIDANAAGIDLIRQGSDRLVLGFVHGRGGSQDDPAFSWGQPRQASDRIPGLRLYEESLLGVELPYTNHARTLAQVLAADLRVALERGEMARVERDYGAMLGLAEQVNGSPILINALVAIGIDNLAFDELGRALLASPERFDAAALQRLAHRTARVGGGGDRPAALIDLAGERLSFRDLLQRIYTDDGHGDGRLTKDAIDALPLFTLGNASMLRQEQVPLPMLLAATAFSVTDTRRDNLAEHERLLSLTEASFARPYRERVGSDRDDEIGRAIRQYQSSPVTTAHYYPLIVMMPSFNQAGMVADRLFASRDALTTALALEIHRRNHSDTYPATLDALVPDLLPRVPLDPVTGKPIGYRVVDGKPVLYSVGVDGDDDHGRLPIDQKTGRPDPWGSALGSRRVNPVVGPQWINPNGVRIDLRAGPTPLDGDWVIHGQPLVRASDALRAADDDPQDEPASRPVSRPATMTPTTATTRPIE